MASISKKKRKNAPEESNEEDLLPKEKTMEAIAKIYNKRYGDNSIAPGSMVRPDIFRIPSGVLAVDYCLGGGIPIWRSSCLWGPPGGGKTTLAILIMIGVVKICWECFEYLSVCKCTQKVKKKSAFIDVEGSFDKEWASALGLDDDDYFLVLPETGEAAVDMADSMVTAQDCGLVIVDSLAALEPSVELEAAAEDIQMGLQARLVSKMFRKVTSRIIQERKTDHKVAALFLNQVRANLKAGKFGNPEEQAGGYAAKFAYSMAARIGARGVDPKKVTKGQDKDAIARSSIRITKRKLRTLASIGEYEIAKVTTADAKIGEILDVPTVIKYGQITGIISKVEKEWTLGGKKYKKLTEISQAISESKQLQLVLKKKIVDRAKRMSLAEVKPVEEDGENEASE